MNPLIHGIVFQVNVLDKLSVRINYRQTISLAGSKYDGAIPSVDSRPITVDQEDMTLFWTLLDYTAITCSPEIKKHPVFEREELKDSPNGSTTPQPGGRSDSAWPHEAPGEFDTGNLWSSDTDSGSHSPTGGAQSNSLDPMLSWDLYQGFDSDWSLLGLPWEAYVSADGWYAPG